MAKMQLKQPQLSRAEFARRARNYLAKAQEKLLPDQAHKFVAINMQTGAYVVGETAHEAFLAYRARWPDVLMYRCRADGGPATKFHGK